MRVLTSRPKRMIAATALFSAITLTGVGAAQATASPTHGGGKGGSAGNKDAAGRAFGSCMREHGLKNFPDLHIQVDKDKAGKSGKGGVSVQASGDSRLGGKPFDPTSKAYQRALKACGPILTKAGVPLPPEPGDGKCKAVKGGKGEKGLPKLPGPPNGPFKGHKAKHIVGPGKGGSEKGSARHGEICVIQKKG
ncbi:hypothetical protein [Streptomyces sp. NBC_01465]|uniref:hypothetical protein n=1 Tax=Streptomyces sp. NBC_01465 TaxID=2903878 RepID=UPI002E380E48|nr:hypothetical protein [Streptomyces sp. NBC_01465]